MIRTWSNETASNRVRCAYTAAADFENVAANAIRAAPVLLAGAGAPIGAASEQVETATAKASVASDRNGTRITRVVWQKENAPLGRQRSQEWRDRNSRLRLH